MVIDHIGVVVKSIEKGMEHWKSVFGYQPMTETVTNTRQKVKVLFLKKDNSIPIKLIEPTDESSPVFAFAKRGGGLHHLCFMCEDVETGVQRCKEIGLRVLADPQPGEAFENEKIAFVFAKQGLNIELIDTDKRAKRLL
jgi:methylmalonyl-CoA/ethylmalonyl-CoA epimerase